MLRKILTLTPILLSKPKTRTAMISQTTNYSGKENHINSLTSTSLTTLTEKYNHVLASKETLFWVYFKGM